VGSYAYGRGKPFNSNQLRPKNGLSLKVLSNKRKKIVDVAVPIVLQIGGKWVSINPPPSSRRLREMARRLGLTDKEVAAYEAAAEPFRHPTFKAFFNLVESERNWLRVFYKRLRAISSEDLWKSLVGDPPDPERVSLLEKRLKACRARKKKLSLSIDAIAKITSECVKPFKPMEWKTLSRNFRRWKAKEGKKARVRRRQS
jgi:hypothetical protein